jgi:cysteine synthase A
MLWIKVQTICRVSMMFFVQPNSNKIWLANALTIINADFNRSSDTHLTVSHKHRLAKSLFLYGLCNGQIQQDTPIIEASSGSTGISEAYFSRLLGLRFIAVVPKHTAAEKIKQIEFYQDKYFKVEPGHIYSKAQQLAEDLNGHYMDQFTYAERATDWPGNHNIAQSIF